MTLGERIKELRKRNNLTQIDLAKEMEVTKGTVSTWETNRRRPSFETLDALASLFNVNMAYLLGSSNDDTSAGQSEEERDDAALSQVEEDLTEYALKYARLDQYGRNAVEAIIQAIIQAEYNRCRVEKTLLNAADYKCSVQIRR